MAVIVVQVPHVVREPSEAEAGLYADAVVAYEVEAPVVPECDEGAMNGLPLLVASGTDAGHMVFAVNDENGVSGGPLTFEQAFPTPYAVAPAVGPVVAGQNVTFLFSEVMDDIEFTMSYDCPENPDIFECNDPADGVCGLDVDVSCCDCWDSFSPAVQERSIMLARNTLWRLTGWRFGCCCITVRPCRDDDCVKFDTTWRGWSGYAPLRGQGNAGLAPYILDGNWYNGCVCRRDCCGAECELQLPHGEVCSVEQVVIDGEVIPLEWFRVYDRSTLVYKPLAPTFSLGAEPGWTLTGNTATIEIDGHTVTVDGVIDTSIVGVAEIGFFIGPTVTFTFPDALLGTVVTLQSTRAEVQMLAGGEFVDDDGTWSYLGAEPGQIDFVVTANEVRMRTLQPTVVHIVGLRSKVWPECFPECNDLAKDITEPGTWAVTYRHGTPWPADAGYYAGLLACELAKACAGDSSCRLPGHVQTVTRQGVSATFIDPALFIAQGLTGVSALDTWLRQVNPYGLKQRGRVFNPDDFDFPHAPRRTWPS